MNRKKLFEEPTNLLEAQLDDLFRDPKDSDPEILMKILNLILYKNIHDTTLIDLFRLLKEDYSTFSKVVTLLSNRTIHFPDKADLDEHLIMSVCFYYREIRGMSWQEIKNIIPVEISPVSYSAKIRSMNVFIKDEMNKMFKELVNGTK